MTTMVGVVTTHGIPLRPHASIPSLPDEFITPPSSLPSEEERDSPDAAPLSQPVPPLELSGALQAASGAKGTHDRFLLFLSDMQVLIGQADEGWREAIHGGRSRLHLLDKFTLSVRLKR